MRYSKKSNKGLPFAMKNKDFQEWLTQFPDDAEIQVVVQKGNPVCCFPEWEAFSAEVSKDHFFFRDHSGACELLLGRD